MISTIMSGESGHMTEDPDKQGRGEETREWRFTDLSVRMKLILTFISVSLVVCIAAGYGIYAMGNISANMDKVFRVASPLQDHTRSLGTCLQQVFLTGFEIIELKDAEKMGDLAKTIKEQAPKFEEELVRIEKLAKANNLELSLGSGILSGQHYQDGDAAGKATQSGIEFVRGMQRQLMSASLELIADRRVALEARAAAKRKLADLRKQTDALTAVLQWVVELSETSFAANEEAAKTAVQVGNATPQQLYEIIQRFYETDYPMVHEGAKLQIYLAQARELSQSYILEADETKLQDVEKRFESTLRRMGSVIKRLKRRSLSDEMKRGLEKVSAGLTELQALAEGDSGIFALHRKSEEALHKESRMRRQMLGAATQCQSAIASITDKAGEINVQARDASEDTVRSANRLEMSITAIGFVLSLLLGIAFSGVVSRPIKQLADRANQISEGDLRVEVAERASKDELGVLTKSFGVMLANLREQTRKTLESVSVLNGASSELSSTISQLVVNSGTFADSVSEITVTVEQVRQSAGVASEKAKSVAQISHEAVRVSAEGKQATDETVSRMTLIKEHMGAVGETVIRLSEQSNAIENIIGIVQDLSDQSNLLAVNASVEAARAGDHGKGFAVVAQEIKSLADQSRQATGQIRKILQETRKWVGALVMATEQGSKAVAAGVRQSEKAGESIDALANTVAETAQAASVIEASSEQQLTGVEQVSRAMQAIDAAIQQHRAGTTQLEELSRNLIQLGESLRQVVDQYRIA